MLCSNFFWWLSYDLRCPRVFNHFFSTCRSISVSGVAFSYDGEEILASYTSEQIYSFQTTSHARPPNAFTSGDNHQDT